jgi:hypothetical protein
MPTIQYSLTRLAVIGELQRRGAQLVPHRLGSLQDHLLGVSEILESWNQPEHLALAGMIHSVYSTDVFKHAVATFDERSAIASFVGNRAESVAALFCSVSRRELFTELSAKGFVLPHSMFLMDRRTGTAVELRKADIAELLILHVANTADQTCKSDRAPAKWLSRASHLCFAAAPALDKVPNVFRNCCARVALKDEECLLEAYRRFMRSESMGEDTRRELSAAVDVLPWVAEPHLCLSLAALHAGDAALATKHAADAIHLLLAWNCSWDKRASWSQWLKLARWLVAPKVRRYPTFLMESTINGLKGLRSYFKAIRVPEADWQFELGMPNKQPS